MTANDIMLGDLVLLDSEPVKITPTLMELITSMDHYGLISGLGPIGLSPEFFEKNGFIQEKKTVGEYRVSKTTSGYSSGAMAHGVSKIMCSLKSQRFMSYSTFSR